MKKLAIIGASYLQQPLVEKAREMGLYTICFAWEDGAVCKELCDKFYPISIVDKDAILKVCREEGIDAVTTIASDVAVLTVNYVAEQMGLIGNPDKYSQTATNKYLMRQCFMENGVPSPKFCLTDGEVPMAISTFRFPIIVKPTDRSGSRGFAWLDTGTHDSLAEASTFVEVIEKRQGVKVGLEGIAYRNGWISEEKMRELAKPMQKNQYGQYLLKVIDEMREEITSLTLTHPEL